MLSKNALSIMQDFILMASLGFKGLFDDIINYICITTAIDKPKIKNEKKLILLIMSYVFCCGGRIDIFQNF